MITKRTLRRSMAAITAAIILAGCAIEQPPSIVNIQEDKVIINPGYHPDLGTDWKAIDALTEKACSTYNRKAVYISKYTEQVGTIPGYSSPDQTNCTTSPTFGNPRIMPTTTTCYTTPGVKTSPTPITEERLLYACAPK